MDDERLDLSAEDEALLCELQRIWGGQYKIVVDDDGWWRAERFSQVHPGSVSAPRGKVFRQLLIQDSIQWHNTVYARNNAVLTPNPAPRSPGG